MLDLYYVARIFARGAYKNFFFSVVLILSPAIYAIEYQDGLMSIPDHREQEWVSRYFNSLDDSVSIEEMIDFLVSFKASLEAKGYPVPLLSDLCLQLRDRLLESGIPVDDEEIEIIYNEILRRETVSAPQPFFLNAVNKPSELNVIEIKHHKKHKKDKGNGRGNELAVSGAFAIGFIKFLGGALLCAIPNPVTITIGGALALAGIKDMIDHAGDAPDSPGAHHKAIAEEFARDANERLKHFGLQKK